MIPIVVTIQPGMTFKHNEKSLTGRYSGNDMDIALKEVGNDSISFVEPFNGTTVSMSKFDLKSVAISVRADGVTVIGQYDSGQPHALCCVTLCGTTACALKACVQCGTSQACCG